MRDGKSESKYSCFASGTKTGGVSGFETMVRVRGPGLQFWTLGFVRVFILIILVAVFGIRPKFSGYVPNTGLVPILLRANKTLKVFYADYVMLPAG